MGIIARRHCIWHKEDTPSLVYYDNGWCKCYGCGKSKKYTDMPLKEEGLEEDWSDLLYLKLIDITNLPKIKTRGLTFHADVFGYYIVWPDLAYYKFRANKGHPKYRCPPGVPKPLFVANESYYPDLIIVEGEINAMSLALSFPDWPICSPGGATEFTCKEKYLQYYSKYENIYVLADNDVPGLRACLKLASEMSNLNVRILTPLPEGDCNDYLVKYGKEKLREEITRRMGVSERMYTNQRTLPSPGISNNPQD